MASTFYGLNIAYTGLTASNAGLNTTANNISNVNTEGYSRQIVEQKAANALRTYTTYGCTGSGVITDSIERARDAFYDFKYWNNNAQVGEYKELAYYMKQIEDYFTDDSTLEGFSTIYNNMYSAIEELAKNSGDTTAKSQFVGYAENLTYYFNTMSSNMQNLQTDVNLEIKNLVSQINAYAREIASLNQQINVIELTGATANELRDQRDLIIDKLSVIVDVKTSEEDVVDTNNPERTTGATRYVVKIAGGQTLVDGSKYNELNCEAKTAYEKTNQSDSVGLYNIYWDDGREFSMFSSSIGGQLRGLIEMRDGNNGENFKGKVSAAGYVGTDYNVTVDVDKDYLKSLNTCTLSQDGGIIRLGNQEYYYDTFFVTYDADQQIESYTFQISQSTEKNKTMPNIDRIGHEANVGYAVDYQGIPYYQEQLNEFCRSLAEAFNKILTQDGSTDGYGNKGSVLFTANSATDTTQYTFEDSRAVIGAGSVVKSTDDSYYYLTAGNFAINDKMIDDPNILATRTESSDGISKYDIVEDMIALRTDSSRLAFRGCAAGDFLQCVLSDIALNAQSANTLSASYENISKSIDNQRLSVSGVDSDEEALNLVQYQHSYNLASQMISVLAEIYDKLINQTGV
ncbi:MAG: flagellar hook-associated protein FlgK [Lachnospiraceae bacterium]|nr:flagellar hook-associated protein FlgK [Lachnospiraceae bacterium]